MAAPHTPPVFAGIELGGTKVVAVLGRGEEIIDRMMVATTTPAVTLGAVEEQLRQWYDDHSPAALGIASFGPLAIDPADPQHGQILATPKPGWAGTDLLGALAPCVDGPVGLATDVIAAALAEGEWGAAVECRDHVYVTVGTGIGMGVIAGGQPVIGRLHPEAGHMRVPRLPGDEFAGICQFHGDCLEGLASGPAIEARAGRPGAEIGDDDPCWPFAVDALAQACTNLLLTLASERIVIGGGVVVSRPWLIPAIESRMVELLGGYLPFVGEAPVLRLAALGGDAGPRGALLLARKALTGALTA
jgi:fructokinase